MDVEILCRVYTWCRRRWDQVQVLEWTQIGQVKDRAQVDIYLRIGGQQRDGVVEERLAGVHDDELHPRMADQHLLEARWITDPLAVERLAVVDDAHRS